MKCARAYKRKGAVLIHSSSLTTHGVWLATEPFLNVAVSEDPAAIGRAVIEALEASKSPVSHPTRWDGLFDPMLKLAGVKSWAGFMKPADSVGIESADGWLTLNASRNEGPRDGYTPLLGKELRLPIDSPPEAIAAALFQAFEVCE